MGARYPVYLASSATIVGAASTFPGAGRGNPPLLLGSCVAECGDRLAQRDQHGQRAVIRTSGDRRSRIRFEAFGAFWGTFDTGDAVLVHNLSHRGALIEAHQPMAVESVQSVCLMLDGQLALADARVRHFRPADSSADARYLVGIEFLAASAAFAEAVDRIVGYRAFPT